MLGGARGPGSRAAPGVQALRDPAALPRGEAALALAWSGLFPQQQPSGGGRAREAERGGLSANTRVDIGLLQVQVHRGGGPLLHQQQAEGPRRCRGAE